MKKSNVIVIAVSVILVCCAALAFLYFNGKSPAPFAPGSTDPKNYEFTYLTSPEETTKFCDGEKMDSEGYRKTITVAHTGTLSTPKPTTLEIIHAVIDAGTTGMCHTVMNQTTVTEKNGIVTIAPIDGWAGVSISMCSCKPQVEVNVLQIPGMKQVIWSNSAKE